MASEKVSLVLLFFVTCLCIEKCSCQFFTKTQKSIPRMGRSVDERTLVLVSKLLANINERNELVLDSTEAPTMMSKKSDSQTGYELSPNIKKQQLLNNYLISKHTTRFLMSLKEPNEQDAAVGSPGTIDQRRKLKSLLATSSIVPSSSFSSSSSSRSSSSSFSSPSISNSRVRRSLLTFRQRRA